MRAIIVAGGMTFPVAYVDRRAADVPILDANSARLNPERATAYRIRAATPARSSSSARGVHAL